MQIDWSTADWAYMLGVIHGDGTINPRSVSVAVSYKEESYKDTLCEIWRGLGFNPKIYRPRSAYSVCVNSKALASALRPFKTGGRWALPDGLNTMEWLSGILDTDGHISDPYRKHVLAVTLKANGNAQMVAAALVAAGAGDVAVSERIANFKDRPYAIEDVRLTSGTRIAALAPHLHLRHPRKAERLAGITEIIRQRDAELPLWKEIGQWLQEAPRDWEEIATRFNLTKPQVDSVMQNLRRYAAVEVIPPPKILTKYRVKGL